MSETTDVWYSVNELKKEKNIINYQLSNLVNDGCCIRCMNNTCNNKEPHGAEFPEQIVYFLSNPLRINIIRNAIKESNLNINNYPLMFNLCHFIYTSKNCINCLENRYKIIKIQGNDVKVCYSDLNTVKNKLTVGLHIDVKFSISNKRININEILPYEKVDDYDNTKNEIKLNVEDKSDFPGISENKHNTKEYIDYSKLRNNINDKSYDAENNKSRSNEINDNSKNKNYYQLVQENNYLKRKVYNLEKEMDDRRYDVDNIKKTIYEKFDNIEYLNNRVITQYFDTNFQDYLNGV